MVWIQGTSSVLRNSRVGGKIKGRFLLFFYASNFIKEHFLSECYRSDLGFHSSNLRPATSIFHKNGAMVDRFKTPDVPKVERFPRGRYQIVATIFQGSATWWNGAMSI